MPRCAPPGRALAAIVATLAVAALAGCLDGGRGPTAMPALDTMAVPGRVDVVRHAFAMEAAAGNQSSSAGPADVALVEPVKGGPFAIREGATALVAEARWTCVSPTCQFHVAILREAAGRSTYLFSSSGSGYARAEAPPGLELAPGTWGAVMRADSAAVGVQGEIRVSVFYDGPAPRLHTAF